MERRLHLCRDVQEKVSEKSLSVHQTVILILTVNPQGSHVGYRHQGNALSIMMVASIECVHLRSNGTRRRLTDGICTVQLVALQMHRLMLLTVQIFTPETLQ